MLIHLFSEVHKVRVHDYDYITQSDVTCQGARCTQCVKECSEHRAVYV